MKSLLNAEKSPEFSQQAAADFAFLYTKAWQEKVADSTEPEALIRQVLPISAELEAVAGFERDPFGETPKSRHGVIQKYEGRLLVMVTWACSAHCRFCFRRNLLSEPSRHSDVQDAFRKRMESDQDISEVILSGGDPLTLSDTKIESWFHLVRAYPQVQRLRIHSREPVFSPERITSKLGEIIRSAGLPVVIVVHANHADELNGPTRRALTILREAGALLLSQTVLLKGVNDSVETLAALFERAADCGLLPYYLHQLDRVAGAAHFEVPRERGLQILDALRRRLPGYLVPRYVEEIPGAASKRPVTSESDESTSA